jgi:molybdopterin-guanine dinucleotide biosynthesis protein A
MKLGGIVLCGGRSRRMGREKAWLPFGSELSLQRVVRIVQESADPVVVVAAPSQQLPELPDEVEILRDSVEGRGPLQGIAAGLAALSGSADAAFVSSCDAPLLTSRFIRRMADLLGDRSIAVPSTDGHFHPLSAVYRVDALPTVEQLLAESRLRPAFLFDELPTRVVADDDLKQADPTLASIRNVNTPEEYERVLNEYDFS